MHMIEILLGPKAWIVYIFLTSALFIHYRGRVRHRFTRQLTDHSTLLAPYNALMYLFSSVPSKPFLDVQNFPELTHLSDNWKTIRDEGLRLFDEGHIRAAAKYNDLGFNSFFRSGWKRFYLKWYDRMLPSAEALCPKTVELVQSLPSVHAAMFAVLPPGGCLVTHRDPFAGSLRYHLGLSTPNSPDCYITVDGENYNWCDGKGVLFDETYIHRAENKTDKSRLILFCDVERPLRNRVMTAINRFIIDHVVKVTASQNVETERVGLANRMFGGIYQVPLVLKRIKAQNRKLYYLIKYAWIALIIYLIFFLW
jgi:beta-hydroxylase